MVGFSPAAIDNIRGVKMIPGCERLKIFERLPNEGKNILT